MGDGEGGEAFGNDYVEQFKLLAKATSGKATAAIVEKVISHKHIFVFADILELPCVGNLAGTENAGALRALEIFAYGVYNDYVAERAALPELSPQMERKLRQLTVVSLAERRKVLPYKLLFEQLGMASNRELEDLLIDGVYMGLYEGKLDFLKQCFVVQSVMGRDLRPADQDAIIERLGNWCGRAETVMGLLESLLADIKAKRLSDVEAAAKLEDTIRSKAFSILERSTSQHGGLSVAQKMLSQGAVLMDLN